MEKAVLKAQKKEEKAKKKAATASCLFSHKTKSSNALVLIKAHSGCWDTLPPTLRLAHAIPRAHSGLVHIFAVQWYHVIGCHNA